MKRTLATLILCAFPTLALAGSLGESPFTVRELYPLIGWADAIKHIGQNRTVQGEIVGGKDIGSRTFLNFHEDYREHFTVVINAASYDNFPESPEQMYDGKLVQVYGQVILYKEKPEIIVASPDQIKIIDELEEITSPKEVTITQPTSGGVKIATYNVLNLFDADDDPYTCDETTRVKPRDELDKLAAAIHKVDADILALQEVENRGVLEQFVHLLLPDMGYKHVVLLEGNYYRGVDVAVLSRLPIGPVTSYRHLLFADGNGEEMNFRRDLLRVRIEPTDGKPFDVFAVHLKSKSGGEEGTLPIRQGEANEIRRLLDEVLAADPQARFVVCGDFNDTIDSQPLKTIIGQGETALKCFADELPEKKQITYNKAPHESMIDFILCSPEMAKYYVKKSYRITPGTVESSGSDHNAVRARFKW